MSKQPLEQLRAAAQKILLLTDGCENLQQAAHKLHLHTESASLADNKHEEAVLDLERVNDSVHYGMQILIDLYAKGSALEIKQDGI